MLLTDSYANVPGLTTSRETYEAEFRWGPGPLGLFANGLISGAARDSGNTDNTAILRPGLVLGQILASGKYTNYSPTAVDGSEVASAVLIDGLRVTDFNNNNVDKFYAVLVGGPVKASKLLNLDLQARACMEKFVFDDSSGFGAIPGNHWFPWKKFRTKTADYTVIASDNFTLFDNTGAGGAITFTLPTLANGYLFGFRVQADQNVTVASAAGDDMVVFNDASADSVAFSTSGEKIGGFFAIFSNPGATKWIVQNLSAGANTVTVAT